MPFYLDKRRSKFIHGIFGTVFKTFYFGIWCHGIIIAVDIYGNRQMDLMDFGFQLIVRMFDSRQTDWVTYKRVCGKVPGYVCLHCFH